MSKGYLLDTHIWLWLLTGALELPPAVIKQLQKACKQGQVYVSVISTWEIGMLAQKGRITLQKDTLQWVQEALKAPGIQLAPLSPEIAIESTVLPAYPQGDPADRMIVATARHLGLTLVTRDSRMLAYAKSGYLNGLEG